ncbi:MAG: hypothetical protein OXU69_04955 [Gemmatimonadota bacterium]|nr:hypothetical protein [Gemmatimonadota bacterium]MDE2984037.1 hypothetical protein [Gemmatimonadota bacterium]
MRITSLQAGSRGPVLDLRGARGLVGFVGGRDPLWDEFLAGLRTAFGSRGGHRGPGPVVEGPEGPIGVGTSGFEAHLEAVLERHGLRREEYGALWFGDGPATAWLAAAAALLVGPVGAAEMRGGGGGGEGSAGGPADAVVARLARDARSRVERLTRLREEVGGLEARLREAREKAAIARGDAEAGTMAWVRERQDAETRLLLYRDRERELRGQLKSTDEAGDGGRCGRCGRELGDRAGPVRESLREEWESVVQDGRWWRRRRDQLEGKPDDLQASENRAMVLGAETESLAEELARRKVQGSEVEAARQRLDDLLELSARLRGGGSDDKADGNRKRTGAAGDERRTRLLAETGRRVRARIHGKVVALTGGRLVGAFPELFAVWSRGGGRGGEDVAVLEVAARIALVELAAGAGVRPDSMILPDNLARLNREDRPRAVAALAGLARRIPVVLVHAPPEVATSVPEYFDLIYRLDGTRREGRIRRQRSGLGSVWLGG